MQTFEKEFVLVDAVGIEKVSVYQHAPNDKVQPRGSAQASILVNSTVEITQFFFIFFRGGGVTTHNFDRIIALLLLYLPIPTRTHNESVRS